jgi:hypothetical protein
MPKSDDIQFHAVDRNDARRGPLDRFIKRDSESFILSNIPSGKPFIGRIKAREARKFKQIRLDQIPKTVKDDDLIEVRVFRQDVLPSVGAPKRSIEEEEEFARKRGTYPPAERFFKNRYFQNWSFLYDELEKHSLTLYTWDQLPVVPSLQTLTALLKDTPLSTNYLSDRYTDLDVGFSKSIYENKLVDALVIVNYKFEVVGYLILRQLGNKLEQVFDDLRELVIDLFVTKRISQVPLGQYLFSATIYEAWRLQQITEIQLETEYYDAVTEKLTKAFTFYERYGFVRETRKPDPGEVYWMTLKMRDLGNAESELERLISDPTYNRRRKQYFPIDYEP